MATDAIITLSTLQCMPQVSPVGTTPYIWPAAVLIDLSSGGLVAVNAPSDANARVVIPVNAEGALTVAIPAEVGVISSRIEDDARPHNLVLVVVLLEKSSTPLVAVEAGYDAFTQTLHDAVPANLGALSGFEGPAAKAAAISNVTTTVTDAVKAAVRGALTLSQKIEVKSGLLVLDGVLDSSITLFPSISPSPLALSFSVGTVGFTYEIYGQLKPAAVVCENESAAVKAATAVVDSLTQQISQLQQELSLKGLPPAERTKILDQIATKEKEYLAPAKAKLATANKALQTCLANAGLS